MDNDTRFNIRIYKLQSARCTRNCTQSSNQESE